MDLVPQKNTIMDNLNVPVWMADFNGSGQITNDWKMWHNGYDLNLLKNFFVLNYPEFLQTQTLREISSPMFPEESSREHFSCVDLRTNQAPYYYPIAIHWWSLLDQLLEQTLRIPDFIINQIANTNINVKILLFNNREQWGVPTWRTTINRIKNLNPQLKDNDFVVSCNNPDLSDLNSLPMIANQNITQYTGQWNTHEDMWHELSNRIYNSDDRPFKFVCLMRRPNASRWAISAELMEYRLRDECLMSMILDTQMIEQNGPVFEQLTEEYYHYVRQRTVQEDIFTIGDYSKVNKLYPSTYPKLQKHNKEYPFWISNDTNALTNPIQDPAIDKFTSTYLHIVSETFVTPNEGVCLSEKVFKPIWYMQPFVVFGTPFTLKALQDLGYKTFDNWIDESYDALTDTTERFYSAINSIKKFVDQDTQTLSNIMKEMLPVLSHNAHILSINNKNLYSNYKKSLIEYLRD